MLLPDLVCKMLPSLTTDKCNKKTKPPKVSGVCMCVCFVCMIKGTARAHTLTHAHAHKHTHRHSHSLTHSLAHTHTNTQTHTNTHKHINTRTDMGGGDAGAGGTMQGISIDFV